MERLLQLRTEKVLDCNCKQLAQSSLQQDDRMPHRTQQICYRRYSSSTRTLFFQQTMWLAVLMCHCFFSVALAQSETVEVTDSVLSTIATTLDVTASDATYTPTAAIFNYAECRKSMDTSQQRTYICRENRPLFPLLKYAESLAKSVCENEFKHERWNCSGFSILKEPVSGKNGYIFKESAYIYSLSLAAIAHTVAKACSTRVISQCGCDDEESGCSNNVMYAFKVAETFLNKRYGRIGRVLDVELIQHNLAAAKQHMHYLINTSNVVCKCHGVSGSCSLRTCLPEFPNFTQIATALKNAYHKACHVVPNGQSKNRWISNCGRNFTDMDLLYRDNFNWCLHSPSEGSLGTAGRECIPGQNSSYSCDNLCSQCGRGYSEHYVEQEVTCGCQFHFCCEIQCNLCSDRRTYYSCSSS